MKEESNIQVRRMKVSRMTQLRDAKLLYHRRYIFVPSLLIAGKWFENAGFSPHDQISVTVEYQKLVIEKVEQG